MKTIAVLADNTLIVEAIRIGLRRSGEFNLLGHVGGGSDAVWAIVEQEPIVVGANAADSTRENAAEPVLPGASDPGSLRA